MALPRVASREEWLAARKELLEKEKDFTHRRDALNTERRNLPDHTYSTFGRGPEQTGGSYYFLNLTALGRQRTGRSRRAVRTMPG